jgi:hypothetical protein
MKTQEESLNRPGLFHSAGTISFTIGVTDSLGNTGGQAFSIPVSAAASGGAYTF